MAIADAIHRGVTEHGFEAGASASAASPRCAFGLPSRADTDAAFGRHGRTQKHSYSELCSESKMDDSFFRVILRPAKRASASGRSTKPAGLRHGAVRTARYSLKPARAAPAANRQAIRTAIGFSGSA